MISWLYWLVLRRQKLSNRTSPPNQQLSPADQIPDELLLKIFAGLHDEWSLFQCEAVCKCWSSLIGQNVDHLLSSNASTILFRFSCHKSRSFHALSPGRELSLEALDLRFLPFWPQEEVRASCRDLLLVSQVRGSNYLVCDPRTRQWTRLPETPNLPGHRHNPGHALVLGPKKDAFTVVILHSNHSLLTFRSETGQWSSGSLEGSIGRNSLPTLQLESFTTRDGTVHWLDWSRPNFHGTVAHNPRTNESYYVQFPREVLDDIIRTRCPLKDKVLLGVVNGRLRLSHMIKDPWSITFGVDKNLKIWELDDQDCTKLNHNSCWKLVHGVKLRDTSFVLAMHPRNGDAVFLACDGQIFSLDLRQNRYRKFGEFPSECKSPREVTEMVASSMKVFTLERSPLPIWLP